MIDKLDEIIEILAIAKGDKAGHEFHGNQWTNKTGDNPRGFPLTGTEREPAFTGAMATPYGQQTAPALKILANIKAPKIAPIQSAEWNVKGTEEKTETSKHIYDINGEKYGFGDKIFIESDLSDHAFNTNENIHHPDLQAYYDKTDGDIPESAKMHIALAVGSKEKDVNAQMKSFIKEGIPKEALSIDNYTTQGGNKVFYVRAEGYKLK